MLTETSGHAQTHKGTKFKYAVRGESQNHRIIKVGKDLQDHQVQSSSYSQYNSTSKFTAEICTVLYHNIKNIMAVGNKINLKKHSSSSSYLFCNSGLFH